MHQDVEGPKHHRVRCEQCEAWVRRAPYGETKLIVCVECEKVWRLR